jgi:hypothetical protein
MRQRSLHTKPASRILVMLTIVWAAVAAILAAQPLVITGTGDPTIDIPAVQAAVDQGGQVTLLGHFSFAAEPTSPVGETYRRMVTISKEVTISGALGANGEMTTVEGGFVPFFGEAPGSRITIQGLHFIRSQGAPIWVFAAAGVVISKCNIEAVEPSAEFGSYGGILNPVGNGIAVKSVAFAPSAAQPGSPGNFSGDIVLSDNTIDLSGTSTDQTLGIVAYALGQVPNGEVNLFITGNNLRNVNERVINVNQIGGNVRIERNVIETGSVVGPTSGVQPDAIHAVGGGTYYIARNTVVSEWATGAGIRVQGAAGQNEAGAVVIDNDVTMLAPAGTVFDTTSAAIEIRSFAQGNTVINNRVLGWARAALVLVNQNGGTPANNALIMNRLDGFHSSLADVLIDSGVTNTVIVGPQRSINDNGMGTIIVPTH